MQRQQNTDRNIRFAALVVRERFKAMRAGTEYRYATVMPLMLGEGFPARLLAGFIFAICHAEAYFVFRF